MTVYIAVGFAAAAVLWLIIWSVKGLLLTPVKLGRSTKASVLLTVSGAEPMLEYTLRSLVWLRENGTLKAEIDINAIDTDYETRSILRRFEAQYRFVNYTEEISDDAGIKRN